MELKPGYKQTEVGAIPEEWELTTVGDAFEIHNTLRFPISNAVRETMPGPYPYYGPTSIQGYINEYRVEGEYALIGEDGDHFLKWQTQPMTLLVQGKFNVNNHAHLVRGTKNLTSWFYYYFSRRDLTPFLTRQGASRYKLTKKKLAALPCAMPAAVAEQTAVAEALSDADALIESLDQLIAKKRQIKQGAMQELLTGKRRLPGFSGDWEDRSLFELAGGRKELFDDGDWIESEHITEDGIRLIQTGNIGVGSFIEKGEKKYISEESFGSLRCKEIKQGDLLICRLAEPAGRACVLPELGESKTITSVDVTIFRPPLSVANRVFLANVFSTAYWFNEVSDRSGGTTHKRISRGSLGGIRVTIPQLDEQTAIATILSDMDTELAALESRLAKARQIKQGMMQELLTGRIRLL